MRSALAALVLLFPCIARADFVYDDGGIPNSPKTDYVTTAVPATQKIVAADWNAVVDALTSERTAILHGDFHGLGPLLVPPTAPVDGVVFYTLADGGGFWVEGPDGTSHEVSYGTSTAVLPGLAFSPASGATGVVLYSLTDGGGTWQANADGTQAELATRSCPLTITNHDDGGTMFNVACTGTATVAHSLNIDGFFNGLGGGEIDGALTVNGTSDFEGAAFFDGGISAGSKKISSVANGTASTDAAAVGQLHPYWALSGACLSSTSQVETCVDLTMGSDTAKIQNISFQTQTAGSGAGTWTISVYDNGTSSTLCQYTYTCVTAAAYYGGPCSSSSTSTLNDVMVKLDSTGCTTAPTGVVAALMKWDPL